jgi:hypothetical protein
MLILYLGIALVDCELVIDQNWSCVVKKKKPISYSSEKKGKEKKRGEKRM